jgi:hypothetical protein
MTGAENGALWNMLPTSDKLQRAIGNAVVWMTHCADPIIAIATPGKDEHKRSGKKYQSHNCSNSLPFFAEHTR